MKLREYRKLVGLKPADAAQQLDIHTLTLWRYESGRRVPDAGLMRKIHHWSKGAVTPNDFVLEHGS